MNRNDGTIHRFTPEEFKQLGGDNPWIQIDESQATPKQRKNKRVSLNDHRSKLGVVLTNERKKTRNKMTHLTPKKKKGKKS